MSTVLHSFLLSCFCPIQLGGILELTFACAINSLSLSLRSA